MAACTGYTPYHGPAYLPLGKEGVQSGRVEGARLRGVDGTKPFVLPVVAQRWPVAHTASCPSVPSTCLDLIYLPNMYDRRLRGTWTTALTPMRSRHFAAPSHLPSLLSFPRFHHRQGNLQSSSTHAQTANKH